MAAVVEDTLAAGKGLIALHIGWVVDTLVVAGSEVVGRVVEGMR